MKLRTDMTDTDFKSATRIAYSCMETGNTDAALTLLAVLGEDYPDQAEALLADLRYTYGEGCLGDVQL